MDWMTILTYGIALVETAALLGALIFITRASKSDKNSPEKKKQTQKAIIFIVFFLLLTTIRNTYFGA